jgi:hypothetical protein
MAEVTADLSTLIFWGGKNEDKTNWGSKWNHDVTINVSQASALHGMENPEDLIPILFNAELSAIKKKEIYEQVYEYKMGNIRIEVGHSYEYSLYRVFGDIAYDELANRLSAKGLTARKPEIHVHVPDRPPVLPEEQVFAPRYDYTDDRQKLDGEKLSSYRLGKLGRAFMTLLVFGGAVGYLAYTALVRNYKELELSPEAYIGTKGEYIAYVVDERLVLFKFDEEIEAKGVNASFTFGVEEDKDIYDRDGKMNRRIIIDEVWDATGESVYHRGNRMVSFNSKVPGYEVVRAAEFEYDSFKERKKPDGDWSKFFDPTKGLSTPIVFNARPYSDETGYWASMGRGFSKLCDLPAGSEASVYTNLADAESYLIMKYAIEKDKVVNLFGQISSTYSASEGRTREAKKLFEFTVTYVRER